MAHRLGRALIVGALLAGVCTSASAAPVIVAVATAFGASAATAAAIGAFFTTWGGLILSVAFSVVGSSQARKKQRRAAAAQRAAYNASLQDRNVTVLSAEAPRQVVYGQPSPIGGAIVAVLTSGSRDQYKHIVLVLANHESESIDEVYFEGEAVGLATRNGSDWMTVAPFAKPGVSTAISESITLNGGGTATLSQLPDTSSVISSRDFASETTQSVTITAGNTTVTGTPGATLWVTYTYAVTTSYLRIKPHLGVPGAAADPYLLATVPAKWTANHKLSGYTYLSITMDLTLDRFQGGSLAFSVKMKGKKVYDPRSALTAYSRNPALCIGDFLRSNMGFSTTLAQLDSAAWIAAANDCDVAAYTSNAESGYSTARYTADGVFRTDQDREGVLQMLEDAMAGATHQSGGVWRIMAGAWATPVMALTDADSAGPIQITQASFPAKSRWNGVRGQYVEGSRLGVPEDFKPYSNATFLAADGVARVAEKNFPLTSAIQRCRHLAAIEVERSRLGLTIQYPAHLRAWPLQPGDRVSITNAEFGWSAKTFRVTDWAFSVSSPVALELVEDVGAVWDLASAVTLDAAPNTGLPSPWVVEALADLAAYSGTNELLVLSDGTIVSRVRLTWTQATGRYVNQGGSVRVKWKRITQTADIWTDVAVSGDSNTVTITGVDDKVGYIFAARFEANVGGNVALGAWTYLDHYVLGKSQPPAAPTGLGYSAEPFGVRLYCDKNTEPDIGGYRWRVGASWGGGAELVNLLAVTNYLWAVQTSGAYTVWVAAVDTSGNESTPTSMAVTVSTGGITGLVAQFVGTDLRLDWTGVAGSFAIGTYEVRYGAVFASATVVGEYNVTRFLRKVDWSGSLRWWVAPRDVNRNLGTEQSVEVVVTVPGVVTSTRSEVVDNNVLLFWSAPATGSLPIDRYEVRKGASWAAGAVVGSNAASTFFATFEQQSGAYIYWVAAYDSAGNINTPVGIAATVNQPPDYILRTDFNSTFTGTKTNLYSENGALIGPANVAESWATHYSNAKVSAMAVIAGGTGYAVGDTFRLNTGTATEHATGTVLTESGGVVTAITQTYLGNYTVNPSAAGATTALTGAGIGLTITPTMVGPWTTPQNQIDAGYPLYIEPDVCQASYDETYDYGTTLAATIVTATLNTTAIVGTVAVTCQIYYKLLIGDAWTAAAAGALSALVTNFRYVRVVWTLTAASGAHLLKINAFNLKLSNKLLTDSGRATISVAASGVAVTFAVPFVDADTPLVQPDGLTPLVPVVDFTDVPNPTGFTAYLYNQAGAKVTGSFSWTARGY